MTACQLCRRPIDPVEPTFGWNHRRCVERVLKKSQIVTGR